MENNKKNKNKQPHKCIQLIEVQHRNLSKLEANSYSICYSIVFQTIKTNLLGTRTVFHYLIITRVQFLTAEYELPPLSRPPARRSDSQNCSLATAVTQEEKRRARQSADV